MEHENHMDHMEESQNAKSSIFSARNLVICLGVVAVLAALITVFKVPISTVAILSFALLCPLMHLWMMKGGHKH